MRSRSLQAERLTTEAPSNPLSACPTPVTRARSRVLLEKASLVVVTGVLVLATLAGAYSIQQRLRWDPLGEYEVQTVRPFDAEYADEKIEGLPAIHWDESIKAEGKKCLKDQNSPETVTVSGRYRWISDIPSGLFSEWNEGVGSRGPGCVSYEFQNYIPDEIMPMMQKLKDSGVEYSVWHLGGRELPEKSDGTIGVERTWTTTSFVIIHSSRGDPASE